MLTNMQMYVYVKYEILTHMKEKYTHTGLGSLKGIVRSEQCLRTDSDARNMNAEIYMHINKETWMHINRKIDAYK